MVEHRRTPGNRVAVPSGWFIVVSVAVVIVAAAWFGVLLLTGSSDAEEPPTAAPTLASPTPTPTPTPSESASPSPSPSPTPTETTEAPPQRDSGVAVLNNTGIANLASSFSGRVAGAGWTVAGTGNWNGQIPNNTVYYPAGQQAAGELLAADLGISRVLPSVAPMQMDRLTLILSGPQQ